MPCHHGYWTGVQFAIVLQVDSESAAACELRKPGQQICGSMGVAALLRACEVAPLLPEVATDFLADLMAAIGKRGGEPRLCRSELSP